MEGALPSLKVSVLCKKNRPRHRMPIALQQAVGLVVVRPFPCCSQDKDRHLQTWTQTATHSEGERFESRNSCHIC